MQNAQRDPKQLIKNARDGDITSLKTMLICVPSTPQLQTKEALEAVLIHLSESKLLETLRSTHSRSLLVKLTSRAEIAMTALGSFSTFIASSEVPLGPLIAEYWPGIFKWMQHVVDANMNSRMDNGERGQNLLKVASALYAITRDETVRSMVLTMPGIMKLSTLVWLSEGPMINSKSTAPPLPLCSTAFYHILHEATPALMDEFVNVAGGDANIIADITLKRLRYSLTSCTLPNAFDVISYIGVVDELTTRGTAPPAVRRAILSKSGVRLVTCALLRLSMMPLDPDDDNAVAVRVAVRCIVNFFDGGDGITNIRMAIQEGILRAFVNICSSFDALDEDVGKSILAMVGVTFPKYLLYHSVLLAIDAEMPQFDTQEYRMKIAQSPIRDAWYRMHKLAAERLIISWKYNDSVMGPQIMFCDNCQRPSQKDALKKCSRCHIVFYCTKECQVAGWKNGHKMACTQKTADQAKITLRKRDRTFIDRIAMRDACHNLPRLRHLAAEKLPEVPLAKLGVSIDYTCVPETYGVFALKSEDRSASYIDCLIPVGECCMTIRFVTKGSLWIEGERIRATGADADLAGFLKPSSEMDTLIDDIDTELARARFYSSLERP
ncbi:hypothetical protein EVG20_g7329 [Dentipellis fragilis]|uniref:MYND-type domain-containing protein n=1 Tax=Dentipellis fragilis TaxID=205917 RepID=A0A4Y9YDT8_9AGAM|nr:hypothetical protein EVG20_g7329 [Dentipellis fragilis]